MVIDNIQYRLRFPTKTLIGIERSSGKFLFGNDNRYSLFDLLGYIGLAEVQAYLLWQALLWEKPEMTFDEACDLRDKYLASGEADDGSRLESLLEALAEAAYQSYGIDRKKAELKKKKANRGTGE